MHFFTKHIFSIKSTETKSLECLQQKENDDRFSRANVIRYAFSLEEKTILL